jgi:monofunctional biosynthetic peptidoglycan transglycosylase
VADKDTRYDLDARGDPLTLTDTLRSEGSPAPRSSDAAEEPDTTRPPRSEEAPVPDATLDATAAHSPPESKPSEIPIGPTGTGEPWHAAIAEALALPEIVKRAVAAGHMETTPAGHIETTATSHPEVTRSVSEPLAVDDTATPNQIEPPSKPAPTAAETMRAQPDASSHEENTASFTDAVEGLFRPSASGPGDETHLVTLGRRLDPSLRIPRPIPPAIEPKAEAEPVAGITWKSRLYTIARYAGLAVAAYLALVLVLIVLFRFLNPPGSMLMLTKLLTGTSVDRTWASFDNISPALVRAVIVSEDGRFCEHSGIDTQAMKEAIDRAAGGAPRGASTISMQVTKNLFLWNAKSYLRKVIEIPLTLIMELIWPKKRILEVYLNIAEWGPGVFGAEAAARHHFNKSAAHLNEREASLLAAVLPNPLARDAGSPGPGTSAKARVVQSRVKAYGAVASCVVAHQPSTTTSTTPARAKSQAIRKPQPLRAQPRKKKVDDWAPILNFGN